MITKIHTVEELKQIFVEILLSKTDKVSKVTDASVLNGTAYGVAKLGQKIMKDVALIESHIFPEAASGEYLDKIAQLNGISPRFAAMKSGTYIRVFADQGTIYTAGVSTVTGNHGVTFELMENKTVGQAGYTYIKVRSLTTGSNTNVDAFSLNRMNTPPVGHKYVQNEYKASNGRDSEDDFSFLQRILSGPNQLAKGTLTMLTQAWMKINPAVLRVFYDGIGSDGKINFTIATQNGANLSNLEFNEILEKGGEFLNVTEMLYDGTPNVQLNNVIWNPIDVSFRCELYDESISATTRKELQVACGKLIDYRYWKRGKKVEWDDLLLAIKKHPNVKYVLDNYFTPSSDLVIPHSKLPIIRGFLMLDLAGNPISDAGNVINPTFYPAESDFSYQQTVLSTL